MQIKSQNEIDDLFLLNKFLYKYFIFFGIFNFILFYTPSENLYLIFYLTSIIIFLILISKLIKDDFFCFFAQLSSIFLIILTQLTFVISFILSKILYDISFEDFLNNIFFCDLKTYALANVYLSFFSLSLILFNKIVPINLIISVRKKVNSFNFDFKNKKLYILIILCIVIEFIYLFTGSLGSQLTGGFIVKDAKFIQSLNEYDDVTWYTQFFYFIVTFHLFLNLLFISKKKDNLSKFALYLILISLILNFLFYGFFVRRMAIQFFLIGIVFFIFFSKIKIKPKLVIFSSLIFILVFQFTNFLQTIRTNEVYNLDKNKTLLQILKEKKIQEYFFNENLSYSTRGEISSNISHRILNNYELASLFYYQTGEIKILKGQLLLNHFIRAIPSKIFPTKHEYPIAEPLISKITNSPLYSRDTTDSFQSFSYADFGIFGLFIYPIILNLLYLLFYKIINLNIISGATGLFIFMLFFPMFTIRVTEINVTDWLVLLRNIVIFILIFNILLSKKKSSSEKI